MMLILLVLFKNPLSGGLSILPTYLGFNFRKMKKKKKKLRFLNKWG